MRAKPKSKLHAHAGGNLIAVDGRDALGVRRLPPFVTPLAARVSAYLRVASTKTQMLLQDVLASH